MNITLKVQFLYTQNNQRIFTLAAILTTLALGTIAPAYATPIFSSFPQETLLVQNSSSQSNGISNNDPNIIRGTVASGGSVNHFIYGTARQNLTVNLRSEQLNAVFTIITPNGTTLATGRLSWIGSLPTTGSYQIIVSSTRNIANYTLQYSLQ